MRGSGNIYRDFGRPNAGLGKPRLVAAKIIRKLDQRKLSTREAERLTSVAHSEFSRIRNAQLRRFTLDRMIAILGKLDADVEVRVTFKCAGTVLVRHVAPLDPMILPNPQKYRWIAQPSCPVRAPTLPDRARFRASDATAGAR